MAKKTEKSPDGVRALALFPTLVTVHHLGAPSRGMIRELDRLEYPLTPGHLYSKEDLSDLRHFRGLLKKFKRALFDHCEICGFDIDDIEITQSWANRLGKDKFHGRHAHPNSFLSGIYYVSGADLTTTFFKDRGYLVYPVLKEKNQWNSPVSLFHGRPGNLLLFPSWLEHGVQVNQSEQERITISFNAIPRGPLGSRLGLTYLDL